MEDKILFVDDEQNVLSGIKRQLHRSFNVDTALGAGEGLLKVKENNYAVIVTDMKMPGKDGVAFLKEVEQITPDTIRMMLTGNSEQQTAIDAVNEGRIFRFMNKPCDTQSLINNLNAGIRQYRLVTAEKELLEQTLTGSIAALIDILSLSSPMAFSQAERIKYYVSWCLRAMGIKDAWKYEIAAMLSHIGYITIPEETLQKTLTEEPLSDAEQEMFNRNSDAVCQMLERIPRMNEISAMIEMKDSVTAKDANENPVIFGAQLLRVCSQLDKLRIFGEDIESALKNLSIHPALYNSAIVKALAGIQPPTMQKVICNIQVTHLRAGMMLADDIYTNDNIMVVRKGQVVSNLMKQRLENFHSRGVIPDRIRAYIAHEGEE